MSADPLPWDALRVAAERSRCAAHAPYSGFAVGAAVLTDDGAIHAGCNVENASYGLTVCAERVAVFAAVAAGARRLRAALVISPGGAAPCGACRQVLAEFAAPDLPVRLAAPDGPTRERRLGDLLPECFGADDLRAQSAR